MDGGLGGTRREGMGGWWWADGGFVFDNADADFVVGIALDVSFVITGLAAAGFLGCTGLPGTMSQMISPIGTFDLVRGKHVS
jgi:hypothetical protein